MEGEPWDVMKCSNGLRDGDEDGDEDDSLLVWA